MRIGTIFTALALVVLMAQPSVSQYSARESFDYPLGTPIDTLMGTATYGWGGAWYKIAATQLNAGVVADTGLPYGDLSYSVANVGNHLESVPDPTGTEQRYERLLATRWPDEAGRTYWISLLMDVKNATDNSTWLGFKVYDGPGGEVEMFGKGHGLDKYTIGSGWHGGEGPEVSTVAWNTGPVWLVGKIVMSGDAANDPTYMWINPDPTGPEPDTLVKDAICDRAINAGIDRVRIEWGGNVGDGLQVSFDEIRMGTSWTDVSSLLATTGVTEQYYELPSQFALSQNYPNPFNPATNISYTLKSDGKVRLTVYDLLGREVAVLVNGVQNAGTYTVTFSGLDLPSGIYFYNLESSGGSFAKKMALVK